MGRLTLMAAGAGLALGVPAVFGGLWALSPGSHSGLMLVASAVRPEAFVPQVAPALPADPEPVAPPPMPVLPAPATGAFDEVLGTWTTRFARYGEERDRAHNVRLAAEALDGAVIAPGGDLSFNARVGERSFRAGYREATVLM